MSSNQDRAQQKGREAREDASDAVNKLGDSAVEAKDALAAEGSAVGREAKVQADRARENTKEAAEKARENTREAAETTRERAVEAKDSFVQRLRQDGVYVLLTSPDSSDRS